MTNSPPTARCEPLEAYRSNPARSFIVRVWLEELGEGQTEWRGRVQDVLSGRITFFRGWDRLAPTILEMLANRTRDPGSASGEDLPVG